MSQLRITKYNPELRDAHGRFRADEWTSVSDIGSTFSGVTLTVPEYLAVESAYCASALGLMKSAGVRELSVEDLEEGEDDLSHVPETLRASSALALSNFRAARGTLSGPVVEDAVRLALREVVWCTLRGTNEFYLHFGHDFYMYAGFRETDVVWEATPAGVFWEACESPYS